MLLLCSVGWVVVLTKRRWEVVKAPEHRREDSDYLSFSHVSQAAARAKEKKRGEEAAGVSAEMDCTYDSRVQV